MPPRPVDAFPRARLGQFPTPLERCDRLRDALGGPTACPEIWVKRDDCTGLAFGGNKVRKLEFLLGQALLDGADAVITFGAIQTNHGRQTAAACARLGLPCELILTRLVPRDDDLYCHGGNRMLDDLFGATVFEVDDAAAAAAVCTERVAALSAEGRTVTVIPTGGSDALGTMGYVNATIEWSSQAGAAGVVFDHVVLAAATCGTLAGTLAGAKLAGLGARVTGIDVYADRDATMAKLRPLLDGVAPLIGQGPVADNSLHLDDDYLGGGYGIPTDAMVEAVALFARTEGLVLDPVYSGKAASGLIGLIRSGAISPRERVLFIHTGGGVGLFAYGPEVIAPR